MAGSQITTLVTTDRDRRSLAISNHSRSQTLRSQDILQKDPFFGVRSPFVKKYFQMTMTISVASFSGEILVMVLVLLLLRSNFSEDHKQLCSKFLVGDPGHGHRLFYQFDRDLKSGFSDRPLKH